MQNKFIKPTKHEPNYSGRIKFLCKKKQLTENIPVQAGKLKKATRVNNDT